MKRVLIAFCVSLVLVLPALAGDFETLNPPYGAKLDALPNKADFVQYKEAGGVSFYHYNGPHTPHPDYEFSSPTIAYGFVDGRLYCCIYANQDVSRKKLIDLINSYYGQVPQKGFDEGEWSVYVWYKPEKQLDCKLKFNNKDKSVKSGFYYRPLKEHLKK